MRAVIMHAPGNVTVEEMPMPTILEPTDAIIKLVAPASAAPTCGPIVAPSTSTSSAWATSTSARSPR